MRGYWQIVFCCDDRSEAELFYEHKDFLSAGYRIYFRNIHFRINKN